MIILPWPPKELSLNARVHRLKKAAIGKKYREACFWLTKQAQVAIPEGRVHLTLTFIQPDRRSRDLDNLLSSIKYGIDGMADGLGINDRMFRPVTIDVSDDIGGMVKVEFSKA
jgi:crossover junction endodeoxyribonuclease RusA